ncbi:MAG: lipolytic protein G-D-S-L family [Rhodocyclaceae bacterium]|nr:MAG: lipolytic protein G-D-S-L family [Rhodocyclaceae bacterium]TNC98964.1 MAG: lipolytic protein G-D-S-L family [Rhodocyclaceae bacterium]
MNAPARIARGFLFLLVLLLAACGGGKKEDVLPAGSKVLALGDSLTAPHGVKPGEDWPTLLGQKTGWVVINGGISGDTSSGALARLPGLLDEHQPQLVLVSLGGNDMLRKMSQAQTVANLGRMLDLAKASGARAVLLATPKPSIAGAVFNNLSPADFYAKVAKDKKVPLIEDALPEVLSDTALKSDQLHPNAAGHALLGEKIHEALKKIGFAG